jgi:hypothetical protein
LVLALLSGRAASCPDHAPFEFGLLPGDAYEHVLTSGGMKGGGLVPAPRPVR